MAVQQKTALVLTAFAGLGLLLMMGGGGKKKSAPTLPTEGEDDLAEGEDDVIVEPPDGGPPIVVDTKEAEADEQGEDGAFSVPLEGGTSEPPPNQSTAPLPGSDPSTWGPGADFPGTNPNDPNPYNDQNYQGKADPAPGQLDQKLAKIAEDEGKTVHQAVDQLATDITQDADILPISAAETSPEMDPEGTVALARLMLSRENMPGWKSDMEDEIQEWQSGAGLVSDGKFGIKSAARMADEVGILPLVRYWPKGSPLGQSLKAYASTMGGVLAKVRGNLPDSAAQVLGLEMSIAREKGQGYGANPSEVDTLDFVQDVQEEIEDMADAKAEEEINA